MKMVTKHIKYVINRFILIICLFYILSSFYFIFKTDEEVSMGLVQHNLCDIILINSLDVHPPFYYLSLKVFLLITTFWTRSIFIKVFFARLFSFMLLIAFAFLIIKILKIINVNINIRYQILFFLLAPGVINESAKIRMYSLSAFLIAFELYQLLLFIRDHKLINIILATISASLASYTFYPLAISTGLLILLFFILELIDNHKRTSLFLFIAGICMALLYVPLIRVAFKQFSNHSSSDGSLVNNYFYIIVNTITQLNANSPTSPLLKYISIVSVIIIILFISLIIYSLIYSSKLFNQVLIITLIDFGLTLTISVIVCKRQFRLTILYPIYSILISLLIAILINYLPILKESRIFKGLVVFTGAIFVMYSMTACANNVKSYDVPSIQLMKEFHQWEFSKSKNIDINKDASISSEKNKIQGNATCVTQDADYLKSLHKNAVVYSSNKKSYEEFISELSNDENNYRFFHEMFTNLKCEK